jgi:hypothetical protein
LSPEAEDAANRRLLSQPEPEDTLPVPLSQYTEDKLRQQMKLYVPSFAKTFARIVTIFGATTLTTTTLLFALNEPR